MLLSCIVMKNNSRHIGLKSGATFSAKGATWIVKKVASLLSNLDMSGIFGKRGVEICEPKWALFLL